MRLKASHITSRVHKNEVHAVWTVLDHQAKWPNGSAADTALNWATNGAHFGRFMNAIGVHFTYGNDA